MPPTTDCACSCGDMVVTSGDEESRLMVRERVRKCTVDGEECTRAKEETGVLFLRGKALTGPGEATSRWRC